MESKNNYLDRFVKEVIRKGAEALLPQNLTQEWLDILLEEANYFEPGYDQDFPENLLLAVVEILSYQKGYPEQIEIDEKELLDSMEKYIIALAGEDVTRKTEIGIEPPTLENVLRDDRQVTAYKKQPPFP